MPSLLQTTEHDASLEDRILGLSEYAVEHTIPEQLRETGLFREDEIAKVMDWLRDYRQQHQLDVIE